MRILCYAAWIVLDIYGKGMCSFFFFFEGEKWEENLSQNVELVIDKEIKYEQGLIK